MAAEIESLIQEYKEEEKSTSPVWIWFDKNESNAKCKLCKFTTSRKDCNTTGMSLHLKRHHGFLSKNNAWKIFEELSSLKDERLKKKRKTDSSNESSAKQVHLT